MSKVLYIKLTKVVPTAGPFTIYDQDDNLIDEDVSRNSLIVGVSYIVDDSVTSVRLVSTGSCFYEKTIQVIPITDLSQFLSTPVDQSTNACIWRHLSNPEIYHSFYGSIAPYVIEYPFAYAYQDEILQNVKDYTKVYKYTQDSHGVSNEPSKIETDDVWFNRAIVYNGQQSSGVLNLVVKPKHDLQAYNSYPIYRSDSKDITFTKSDNFYQFNTFWDVVKDKTQFLFVRTCAPLSIDKEIHQENMDYTYRSFRKSPLRAKDLKIRLTLDNRSDAHLVSQIIYAPTMISYK